ncbi:MAG: hypothetical protein HXY22_09655 [Alphaproteobacteria bacterium]|nr:hypothetical protein [Alphaproteobacteria bacterium]
MKGFSALSRRGDAGAASRVKDWVVARFGDSAEQAVLVSETQCLTAGCPPTLTVIAILTPCACVRFQIHKSLGDVTQDDISALGHAAPLLPEDLCC